ncbi:VWA domain-containing protein [Cryptosporangium phraense]|uniref:VWA domain-containing protein n=1 Tax=Cryptosporangium phraense TaxID=2593070 RepID=A0A545ASS5_9ACTN|nr:VWA domain-containing protein [Cryptosporangium phraense]TQS44301.1 VWA domain-containing protein [Cryptosporangium phraense]
MSRRLWPWVAGGVGAVLAATAGFAGVRMAADDDGRACGERTVRITVAAALDQAPALQTIADNWQRTGPTVAGACPDVRIIATRSAEVAANLGEIEAAGGSADSADERPEPLSPSESAAAAAAEVVSASKRPTIWAPDSRAWAELASTRPDAAALLPEGAPSVAVSPVVIAAAKGAEAALGGPSAVSWPGVLRRIAAGRGTLRLGMTDPTESTAALLTLMSLADANGDGTSSPAEIAGPLALERTTRTYAVGVDALAAQMWPGEWAGSATGSRLSLFPATEQEILRLARIKGTPPLVPLYPAEGVAVADHPFYVLDGAWVTADQRAVATAFRDVVLGSAGRAAYGAAGFRDRDGTLGALASVPLTAGAPLTAEPRTRALPDVATLTGVLVRWRALRRPANVIAAVDTSGSMTEKVPGLPITKLDAFRQAGIQAVRLFNDRSRLGLWEFSSNLSGTRDYRVVVPVRTMAEQVGPVSQRETIVAATNRLRPHSATGLYDTIDAAYRAVQGSWRPDQQNILVVMTDGRNEDRTGLSLPQLLARLRSTMTPAKPITVLAIAYGSGADVEALQRVTAVTGGRTFVSRNPADIGAVLLSAMVNR